MYNQSQKNALLSLLFCLFFTACGAPKPAIVLDSSKHIYSFFAPDDRIKNTLIELIANEKKQILVAAFRITEKAYATELIKAYNRGVHIEIVADSGALDGFSSVLESICKAKVNVYLYPCLYPMVSAEDPNKKIPLMHDKFMIFDESIDGRAFLWTGSLNFTYSAHCYNQENCVLLDDGDTIAAYKKQFEKLKTRSEQVTGEVVK